MHSKKIIVCITSLLIINHCTNAAHQARLLVRSAQRTVTQQQLVRASQIKNDFGIIIGIAAVAAGAYGIYACTCKPESDQALLGKIDTTLHSAQRSIELIGGTQNRVFKLQAASYGEAELAELAAQMNVVNVPACNHIEDLNSVKRKLNSLSIELEKRIHAKAQDISQASMISAMKTALNQIDYTMDLLNNRLQLVEIHLEFFELYRVKALLQPRYKKLLTNQKIEDKDLRCFANNTFQTKFPYLDFVTQLSIDIAACSEVLISQNPSTYLHQYQSVVTMRNALEAIKDLALSCKDYQEALTAKHKYEIEQQKIAQAQQALELQKQQALTQERHARAAEQQAQAQTVSAAANAINAAAALKSAQAQEKAAQAQTVVANAAMLQLDMTLNQQEGRRR